MSYNPIITVNTHINDTKIRFKVPFGFGGGDSNLYGYVLGDPVNFVDPTGELAWFAIPLFFALGDTYLNTPTIGEKPKTGMTPMNELGLCLISTKTFKDGNEFTGNGWRVAPVGNRTENQYGKYPHYNKP